MKRCAYCVLHVESIQSTSSRLKASIESHSETIGSCALYIDCRSPAERTTMSQVNFELYFFTSSQQSRQDQRK